MITHKVGTKTPEQDEWVWVWGKGFRRPTECKFEDGDYIEFPGETDVEEDLKALCKKHDVEIIAIEFLGIQTVQIQKIGNSDGKNYKVINSKGACEVKENTQELEQLKLL